MLSTSVPGHLAEPAALVDGIVVVNGHPRLVMGRGAVDMLRDVAEPTLVIGSARAAESASFTGPRFSDFTPNPTPTQLVAATAFIEATDARTVIGIGGGSAMDLAKAAALAARQAGRRLVLVQVPTTAGTGAEVTPFGSIWPPDGPKYSVDDARAVADVAVIDWQLSARMPAGLTAITGLDALVHAVETQIGRQADDRARRHSVRALTLIGRHLRSAVNAPQPIDRAAMSLAATHAGLGLAVSRSAAAHALSYTLTGRFGVPHGLAVALLARGLMPMQRRLAPEACAAAEAALGAPIDDLIAKVLADADLPARLGVFGVTAHDLTGLAEDAARSVRLANNPGPPTVEAMVEALERIR